MNIIYGSSADKLFICVIYLAGVVVGCSILIWDKMFYLPYVGLPIYLLLCCLLLVLFPLRKVEKSLFWGGLYRVLPVVLFLGFIYYASTFTISSQEVSGLPDYILHGGEFFALGLFTARMITPKSNRQIHTLMMISALLFVIGNGWLDELHQSYVPTREQSTKDLISDAIGGFFGILTYHFISNRRKPI